MEHGRVANPEKMRIEAIASANYVFDCLTRIDMLRGEIRRQREKFNPAIGDNATRRDCAAFAGRLEELALGAWLEAEARLGELLRAAHNDKGNG